MSNLEVMNSNLVSYEVARDLAGVANATHSGMLEAKVAVDAAEVINNTNISGVALEAGSLAVLAGRYRIATNSFVHAENSVPNFYTGVLDGTVTDVIVPKNINLEILTPEEQSYKEIAVELLTASHNSYDSYMHAMNNQRNAKNKLPVATYVEACSALEAVLTPAQIRAEMTQIAEFTANPEANSPEAGFDTVLIPNVDLTAKDETAIADYLQGKLTAYKGDAYTYEPLHNKATAHTKADLDTAVQAVRVPRHLNVRAGNVASQKATIEAHNSNPDTDYRLDMADDITAMSHIALLADTGAIDTTNQNYDETRFWSTYYKNVLATPVGDYVPSVCVLGCGQLFRGGTVVRYGGPTRALVVPKA